MPPKFFIIVMLILPFPANALCLNPLGCEPKTYGDCLKQAKEARTETAAKAQISDCKRLPTYTEDECNKLASEWANYLQSNNGVEWGWPKRDTKSNCRKNYPSTFKSALWVTKEYCTQNASRISKSYQETNPVTGKSKLLEMLRREAGGFDGAFDGISDYGVIELVQKAHFKDYLPEQLAVKVYFDSPPDITDVYRECQYYLGE
jgi:hypothetical protein